MSQRKELLRKQIARLRCAECGQAPTASDIKKVLRHPNVRDLDPTRAARIRWMCDPCGAMVETIDSRTIAGIVTEKHLQTVVTIVKNRARKDHQTFGKRPTYSTTEEEARAKIAAAAQARKVESVFRDAEHTVNRHGHAVLFFPPSTVVTVELSIDGMANALFWHLSISKPFEVEVSGTQMKRIGTETILRVPDDVATRVVTAFLGDAAEEKVEGVLKNVRHFYARYDLEKEPQVSPILEPQADPQDAARKFAALSEMPPMPEDMRKRLSESGIGSQIFAQSARAVQAVRSGLQVPDMFVIHDDEHLRNAVADLRSSKLAVVDRPVYPSSMEETVAQFARRRASDNHRYASLIFETMGVELLLTKERRESIVWHMTLMRYPDLNTMKEAMETPFLILRVPDDVALRIAKAMNMIEGPAEGAFANIRHFFSEV